MLKILLKDGAREMASCVKVPMTKPEFTPQNPSGGRSEQLSSDLHTCTKQCTHTHTH